MRFYRGRDKWSIRPVHHLHGLARYVTRHTQAAKDGQDYSSRPPSTHAGSLPPPTILAMSVSVPTELRPAGSKTLQVDAPAFRLTCAVRGTCTGPTVVHSGNVIAIMRKVRQRRTCSRFTCSAKEAIHDPLG